MLSSLVSGIFFYYAVQWVFLSGKRITVKFSDSFLPIMERNIKKSLHAVLSVEQLYSVVVLYFCVPLNNARLKTYSIRRFELLIRDSSELANATDVHFVIIFQLNVPHDGFKVT